MDSIEQGKAAMEKTVIPYVREIQAASPEAEVSVEISSTDVNDNRPVAVEIRIGSKRIEVETNAGQVIVRKVTPTGRHNLSGNDISTVADLTRENLGRLFDKVPERKWLATPSGPNAPATPTSAGSSLSTSALAKLRKPRQRMRARTPPPRRSGSSVARAERKG